jgi:hypothetical protein
VENENGEKVSIFESAKEETLSEESGSVKQKTENEISEEDSMSSKDLESDDYIGMKDALANILETDEKGQEKLLFTEQGAENILQNVRYSEAWMQKLMDLAKEQGIKVSDEFNDLIDSIGEVYEVTKAEYEEAKNDKEKNRIEAERKEYIKELIAEFLSEKKNKLPKVKMSVADIRDISEYVILKPIKIYGNDKINLAKEIAKENGDVKVQEATIMSLAIVSGLNAWDAAKIRFAQK